MESQLGLIEQSLNVRYSLSVREALDELPDSFAITDPCISGHPIVFASHGLLKMSGYSRDEVIGDNERIFQGPKTNRKSVMEIREAIKEERAIQISVLNYPKDGAPFWMLYHMCPVFSKEDGRVIHFVCVQVPILRKQRRSRSGSGGNEINLCKDGLGFWFGSCRREVWLETVVDLGPVLSMDSFSGSDNGELEVDETWEASDIEKQKGAIAINSILSVLTLYSESMGRPVSGKRCCLAGTDILGLSIIISLGRIKQSFVLTDPHLPDMPIVYASDAFLKLTGFARHEVLGRNCRFLSGADTDCSTIFLITKSIWTEQACTIRILNYRKDRSSFWNLLHISPVRNAYGKIAYYVWVQIDESCKNQDRHGMSPEMRQHSAVGAVKVAVRSLSIGAGNTMS